MKTIVVGIVIATCSLAHAGELVLPVSGLHVALDDAWRLDGSGDLVVAGDERVSIDVVAAGDDHTCVAMLDGPTTSDLSWGKADAKALGLPGTVHAVVRVDRSAAGKVQRIGCVQGATTTLTFGWVATGAETDADRTAAARAIGAIATAYTEHQPAPAPVTTVDAIGAYTPAAATVPSGAAAPGDPAQRPHVPGMKRPKRTAAAAPPPPAEPDLAAAIGPKPGTELMASNLSIGYLAVLPSDVMVAGASALTATVAHPIRPFKDSDFGYEALASLGADAGHTFAVSSRAGLGYHALKGTLGLYAIGGVSFDWVGSGGGEMTYHLPPEPGVYAGGVARMFVTDHTLVDLRASKSWRLGRIDAIDTSVRVAWTPDEHRSYILDAYLRDYGTATLIGVAVGVGF